MRAFVWRRAAAIAKKEVFHILRDPFTMAVALVLPVLMIVVYGISMKFDVKNVAIAVCDFDRTQDSRRLMETFGSSGYFRIHRVVSPAAALADVSSERDRAAMIIPPNFQRDLIGGRGARVQILVDGTDNSTVGPVVGYVSTIQNIASSRLAHFDMSGPYEVRTRFLFNPELSSAWFVIPGLFGVIMSILLILLTALTVAREWENGSMELLLSTPVQPLEIITGKIAPYTVLSIIAILLIYGIARAVFHVPFVGNLGVFALGCFIFMVTYLSIGILISVTTRNQVVAMQLAQMAGMMPSTLLSGFIFPISSMPLVFRYLTAVLPARWYIMISRDTFLKGSSFLDLGVAFMSMTAFCLFMIALAVRRFKKDIEP